MLMTFSLFAWTKTLVYDNYFNEAGEAFNVSPLLLKKIAVIESSLNPYCVTRNKNGTKDYGIMQINTIHLKELAHTGINEKTIMNPRVNIHVGAKILSTLIRRYGMNFEAIGRYHSNTPEFKARWNAKLIKELKESL